jgi:hypothetical protein
MYPLLRIGFFTHALICVIFAGFRYAWRWRNIVKCVGFGVKTIGYAGGNLASKFPKYFQRRVASPSTIDWVRRLSWLANGSHHHGTVSV